MFGSTMSPFASRRIPASALYRSIGVETGVSSAGAHQLVTMLFDGLLEAMAEAVGAIQAGQIEAKGRALGRAVRIVEEGLKAGLNLREGGPLANDLRDLYAYTTLRLTQANLRSDLRAIEECKKLIEPLREAWISIAPKS
jgi:flagellar secretion chaperone FliS